MAQSSGDLELEYTFAQVKRSAVDSIIVSLLNCLLIPGKLGNHLQYYQKEDLRTVTYYVLVRVPTTPKE